MSHVLTYVDEPLARQLATSLIGSEVQLSETSGATAGINFKVLLTRNHGVSKATTTRTIDLLPELVAEAIYEGVAERIPDLQSARSKLIAGGDKAYRPGTPVILTHAVLGADNIIESTSLGGEECVQYRARIGEFYVHAFSSKLAHPLLRSLLDQPVEVAGILRYTAPYPIPGALSLSLGLRICAVWLR